MTNCQVSTIMVVPHDGVHHDTLNVGVILYDPDRNVAYRKVTDNWAEVRRRTGFRYNAGRGEGVQGPYSVGDNYLENLGFCSKFVPMGLPLIDRSRAADVRYSSRA